MSSNTPTPFTLTSNSELNDKLSAFFAVCYFFNELIEGLMSNVSLMTRREKKRHIEKLELFPTLGLKDYEYLYFAFDNTSEFEGEVYSPITSSDSEDDVVLLALTKKGKRNTVSILRLQPETIEHIQKYAHSFSLQCANRFFGYSKNRFVHHYLATNIHAHQSVGLRCFIHKNVILD